MKSFLSFFAIAVLLVSCSDRSADSIEARTLRAWKSIQTVNHDHPSSDLPKSDLSDPSTLKAGITWLRNVASAYSQIDTESVDAILANHLSNRIRACRQLADALENEYSDIVRLVEQRQENIRTSRGVGQLLADDQHQDSGAAVGELFYQLFGGDEDFDAKLRQIQESHSPELMRGVEAFQRLKEEGRDVAEKLRQRYGPQFTGSII
jgi:hypothetical protein